MFFFCSSHFIVNNGHELFIVDVDVSNKFSFLHSPFKQFTANGQRPIEIAHWPVWKLVNTNAKEKIIFFSMQINGIWREYLNV